MPLLSIVIPVYHSEKNLTDLYQRLIRAFLEKNNFEIIMIDDFSSDNSWKVIQELAKRDPRIKGYRLSKNFGQHAATLCGFSKAQGDWIATLDDDLEQPPELLPQLLQKAFEGFDLVYGVYPQRTHSSWRNLTSAIVRCMFNLAIPTLNSEYTSFRVIRGNIARELTRFDSPFPFVDGYLSWVTNKYATVQVPHQLRANGKSNYTIRKLFKHTINIFVTFSDLPLKVATWIGLVTSFLGLTWLLAILIQFFNGGISVSGFSSIMAAILTFGGIQLSVLGVFGEYLGRINFKSSKKPLFLVGQETERAPREELKIRGTGESYA